jgi:hypothetical protein
MHCIDQALPALAAPELLFPLRAGATSVLHDQLLDDQVLPSLPHLLLDDLAETTAGPPLVVGRELDLDVSRLGRGVEISGAQELRILGADQPLVQLELLLLGAAMPRNNASAPRPGTVLGP